MRSSRLIIPFMFFILTTTSLAQEVTFQQQPYVAGMEVTSFEHKHISMDVEIDAGGSVQKIQFSEKDTISLQRKILDVQDGYPIAYKLKVKTFESKKNQMGKTEVSSHPCSGNTYLLNFKDTTAIIEAEDGHALSDEELNYLREKSRPIDKMKLAEAISGKTFVPGQRIDSIEVIANSFKTLLKENSFVKDFQMTYKEIREINSLRCGVFDFQMTLENSNEKMEMTAEMKGEMCVTVDGCFPVQMSLKGNMLGVAPSGASVTFDGDIDFWGAFHYSR